MAGPGNDTGKGKGKVKPRDGGDGSVARPAGETTPRPGRSPESGLASARREGKAVALFDYAVSSLCSSDPPAELPLKKTVCIFAATVAVLAVCRSLLLPIPAANAGNPLAAGASGEQHDKLVRLVLAEELRGVVEQIETEDRAFDALLKRQAGALDEVKDFEERLKASGVEIRELEGLGKTLHEDSSGDAGLSTKVAAEQEKLRDVHRSVTGILGGFKKRLSDQSETMALVRSEVLGVREEEERTQVAVAAAMEKHLEANVKLSVADVVESHQLMTEQLSDIRADVLTKADLEVLLEDAAQTAERPGDGGDVHAGVVDLVRDMSAAVADAAVGRVSRGKPGCVSEERVLEEVDFAIEKLSTDGTGIRDYANANVGGNVIEALTSETYTPASWWGSSRYWHGAGVENGIGPVKSVISEDSSLGACWALKGSEGHVTIELAKEITVDGISLEHASRLVTLENQSAPRDFQVYGLRNKADTFPAKLGSGVYDINRGPIQTFRIEPLGRKFPIVQIRFLSNWGNLDYTCIYRVRVHGRDSYNG